MYMAEAGAEKEVNIGRCEGEGQEEEIPLTESHSGGKMVTFSHDLVRGKGVFTFYPTFFCVAGFSWKTSSSEPVIFSFSMNHL